MADVLPGLRVLIVEDEFMIALDIQAMITDLGCAAVALASTVEKALSLLEQDAFDIVLLDINLSGASSFPVAEMLAERKIPFAFLSGYDSQILPASFAERPILKKPFSERDLSALLTNLCGQP